MTTASIYCRVSTAAQEEEGTSLETQEARCRQYAAAQGYTVSEAHVYRETFTGIELWDRPKLGTLRAAVRKREINVVIAYAIDRLARDPVHLGVVISEAEHAGAAVEFVTEPLDNSPEGQLIRFVRGYAAKVEHMKIRERALRGKRARVDAGKVPNQGVELYGYRRNKQAGTRAIYEPEATIVRRIFTWVGQEGMPLRTVARRLNDDGVPPPATGKVIYKKNPRTSRWGKSQIHRVLSNPNYKGEATAWRWRTGSVVRPESEWVRLPDETTPALVAPALWDAAQQRLISNRGEATRNAARPYLLRGMIVCGVCGKRMNANPERGRRTYRCSSRDTASGACGSARVPGDDVETWVWDEVATILRDPETVAAELRRRREAGADSTLAADLDAARRALVKLEKQGERLIRRFREADDDNFPWDLVQREIAHVEAEKKQLQTAVVELEQQIAQQDAALNQLDALMTYCATAARNLEWFGFAEKRIALEALAVRVLGNGRDWRLHGSIPVGDAAGVVSQSSCSQGRRARARR